ncbi:ribonuclease T2 [Pasteurella langaaensis DSM 22999]|uniref:Ribonuclease T2 n=1 Tax=Alitibacter langaaensis DSM 22999 TaxID=1122935 RepID=A0A2U0TGH1_9PAST|nr:ribonuclease [Pasteurella langaaensis]PVX42701.1 ribonuclease T2 [Pasteurella langaaensis DSM 22999]
MNQKYVKWIRIGAVLLLAGYFYLSHYFLGDEKQPEHTSSQQKHTKSTQSAQNQSQSAVKNSSVLQHYDTIMRDDAIGQNKNAPVDYYMLALSWSPTFCESQERKFGNDLPASSQMQCGTQRQYGWVIHGLWPQNAHARTVTDHPRFCQGDLPQLDYNLIEKYLPESPSPKLLQGEWEKHGACAFKTAEQYFQKQQELYRTLALPTQEMSRKELFRWMKQNNPQLKNAYMNASRSELFICYDLAWRVMDCPNNK